MTRGNQRDLARAKNLKKQQEMAKAKTGPGDGLTLSQRKERDAQMMRDKQQKKQEDKQKNNS